MKTPQGKPSGNFQFRNAQQQAPKPNAPPRNIGDRRCYNCGQPGHYISDYPKPKQNKPNPPNQGAGNKPATPAKKPMVQVRQGKLNFTTMSDIPQGASVLTGTFSINDTPVKILFDSEANHSFLSENLLSKLGLRGSHTKSAYKMIIPGVVWTSLGPLPRWVPGPTTRWAPGTTRLALHGTLWREAQGLQRRSTRIGSRTCPALYGRLLDVLD
jgi:hypothetical protein